MKIISFNSYKGGACRTTTCYNTLPYLAKILGATAQQPILVFDIDLDSMGLTSIFRPDYGKTAKPLAYSARNLFVDDSEGINDRLRKGFLSSVRDQWYFGPEHFQRVGNDLGLEDNESVLFCGADENAGTISDDDFRSYKENPPLQTLIMELESLDEEEQPKAIVFDCASGVQMSTIAALSFVQHVVVCMRPTLQFRLGTYDYLCKKIPNEIRKAKDNTRREVILLPTSVASNKISESDPNYDQAIDELDRLRKRTKNRITQEIVDDLQKKDERILGYTLNSQMAELDDFGLPEIERFKWQEFLLYKEEALTESEKHLKKKYEQLAEILAREV